MKLSLGTAQFGLRYGISNKRGLIKKKEINKILNFSLKNNILDLDTAKSYGNAESTLGQYKNINKFKINTKISNLNKLEAIETIEEQVNESIKNLKINNINICFLHNFNDIKNISNGKKIFQKLVKLKKEKKIKKIGISLYSINELNFCLANYKFDAVQIPLNIINQDFNDEKLLNKLKKRKIEIEIRSVFLQGLVFLDPTKLKSKFNPIKKKLMKLRSIENNNQKILTYCLKFVKKNKNLNRIIVGTTSLKELETIIRCFNKKNYYRNNFKEFRSHSIMRNPSKW